MRLTPVRRRVHPQLVQEDQRRDIQLAVASQPGRQGLDRADAPGGPAEANHDIRDSHAPVVRRAPAAVPRGTPAGHPRAGDQRRRRDFGDGRESRIRTRARRGRASTPAAQQSHRGVLSAVG